MEESFWLVWNPNRDMPRARHSSKLSAKAEAERLAALQPGDSFFVLQAIGKAECRRPVEYTALEEIPF